MLEPAEDQVVWTRHQVRASFLIRFFEIVRQHIHADVDRQYRELGRSRRTRADLDDAEKAELLRLQVRRATAPAQSNHRRQPHVAAGKQAVYGTNTSDHRPRRQDET